MVRTPPSHLPTQEQQIWAIPRLDGEVHNLQALRKVGNLLFNSTKLLFLFKISLVFKNDGVLTSIKFCDLIILIISLLIGSVLYNTRL